jgi:cellulase
MHITFVALTVVASAVQQALAHGYVPQIKIGNDYITGWDVGRDGYTTPRPSRVVRATKPDSGYIADVTSKEITCSVGNNPLPAVGFSITLRRRYTHNHHSKQ